MTDRKKKLRLIQFFLLFTGITIIFLTYYKNKKSLDKEIISKETLSIIEQ